jgi:multiple sugar transport system permease protein
MMTAYANHAADNKDRVARRLRSIPSRVLVWLMLLVLSIFFIVPILWLLLAPTKTNLGLIKDPPLAFGNFENVATAWNNLVGFQDGVLFTWLLNSVGYSAGALALTLLTVVPSGYALAHSRFRGRKLLLILTLVVMLVPGAALVLPIYLEINIAELTGSYWSVILPSAFFPFGVYLTYIYYATSLSQDILAAARIDGCNEWQIFRLIALPLARPIVALVAFFSFVANWNNYFLPLVMLVDRSSFPIQLGLTTLQSVSPSFNPLQGGAGLKIDRPEIALAVLISSIPVLILFLISQRSLTSGLLTGATKG